MALRATVLLVLTAALALPPAVGSAAPKRHPCDWPGTIKKNRFVHVYNADGYFMACSYTSEESVELGFASSSSSGFYDAFDFTLAGRFVAYTLYECPGMDGGCEVKELRLIDTDPFKLKMRHPFGNESAKTITVKPNGSIAYLLVSGNEQSPSAQLHRRDRRGRAMIASGSGADAPRDLRLKGSTLHWRQGKREFTKTLR
jgi:hypothetical protein